MVSIKTMKKILTNNISKFIYISFGLVALSAVIYVIPSLDYNWLKILWNDFLAVIPLFCAMFAYKFFQDKRKAPTAIFLALWLLFFPNSPYMITDVKYSSGFDEGIYMDFATNGYNVNAWLLVFSITVAVVMGILYGMLSLYIVHTMLKKRFGKIANGAIITAVMLLSSFGVYIGRFARVNSWDIVRPAFLFDTIMQSMTSFMPVFVALMTITLIVIYLAFYYFAKIFSAKNVLAKP